MEGMVDSIQKLCDEGETVNGFCYSGDKLKANWCDSIVVGASALQPVNLGFIFQVESYQNTL